MEVKRVETFPELIGAFRLRTAVFVVEQGFDHACELDEFDAASMHFVVLKDGKVIAAGRARESEGGFRIERMCVEKELRGKGIGKMLLLYVISELKKLNPKRIWLRSQLTVQKFYEKCGFVAISQPFEFYGKTHVDMELNV